MIPGPIITDSPRKIRDFSPPRRCGPPRRGLRQGWSAPADAIRSAPFAVTRQAAVDLHRAFGRRRPVRSGRPVRGPAGPAVGSASTARAAACGSARLLAAIGAESAGFGRLAAASRKAVQFGQLAIGRSPGAASALQPGLSRSSSNPARPGRTSGAARRTGPCAPPSRPAGRIAVHAVQEPFQLRWRPRRRRLPRPGPAPGSPAGCSIRQRGQGRLRRTPAAGGRWNSPSVRSSRALPAASSQARALRPSASFSARRPLRSGPEPASSSSRYWYSHMSSAARGRSCSSSARSASRTSVSRNRSRADATAASRSPCASTVSRNSPANAGRASCRC